jgi:hypothetical protein
VQRAFASLQLQNHCLFLFRNFASCQLRFRNQRGNSLNIIVVLMVHVLKIVAAFLEGRLEHARVVQQRMTAITRTITPRGSHRTFAITLVVAFANNWSTNRVM